MHDPYPLDDQQELFKEKRMDKADVDLVREMIKNELAQAGLSIRQELSVQSVVNRLLEARDDAKVDAMVKPSLLSDPVKSSDAMGRVVEKFFDGSVAVAFGDTWPEGKVEQSAFEKTYTPLPAMGSATDANAMRGMLARELARDTNTDAKILAIAEAIDLIRPASRRIPDKVEQKWEDAQKWFQHNRTELAKWLPFEVWHWAKRLFDE